MIPEGIVTTGWPKVEAKGRELGLSFDGWQAALGRVVLGKRADGKYAATVGGVVLSIPRQVGKTYFVMALLLIMCILFPGLQVVWTAHHLRVSTRTFKAMRLMMKRPKLRPYLLHERAANGEQEIAFRNGSVVMFGSREKGFRGFDAVDVEVFDEAQMLSEAALEDMVAATNQARHPHGALLFYMGTPPRPIDNGEAFTARRSKAISNRSTDMIYLECSADPDADLDDVEQWRKANLSYPRRTPHESLLRLRENLANDDGWRREGLGIWDDDSLLTALPLAYWRQLADSSPEPVPTVGPIVLGVDSTPERTWTSIVAAGLRPDGVALVELTSDEDGMVDNRPGVEWALDRIVRIAGRNDVSAVVIDKRSTAATLIQGLQAARIRVIGTDAAAFIASWGVLHDAVVETGRLRHLDQVELNEAVRNAGLRTLNEAVVPDRKRSGDDITPLIGAQLALWALLTNAGRKPGRGRVVALG